MKIKTFKVERWMNEFEDDAVYNLGETCIDSLKIGELLSLCGEDPDTFLKGHTSHLQPHFRLAGISGRRCRPLRKSQAGKCHTDSWSCRS